MKRKIALVICLIFCLSLLSNAVYAISETEGKDKQQAEQEQKITSLEELPEKIKNSKWFKLGMEENLYNHPTVYDLIGKSYLGESIEGILLMSEEIKDFDLKEFLGSSVCSKYTIADLKAFKKQGMKTLMDIYEQEGQGEEVGINKILKSVRNAVGVPSVGSSQWGTLTITGEHMYENSKAPALVGAFRNAGLTNQWYISLFNIRLSGFGGEFAWLNGKTFDSIGNSALLSGDITSFVRCLTPKAAAPKATMQAACKVTIERLEPDNSRIKVSLSTQKFGSGYQAVGGPVYLEYTFPEPPPKDGYVTINKSSSKPELTDGNSSYSLKGAKFSVWGCDSNFEYEDWESYSKGEGNPKGLKWYDNFIIMPDGTARRQVYVSDGYEYVDEPDIGSILVEEHEGREYYFYYEKKVSSLNVPVGTYGIVEEFVPERYGYSLNNTVENFEVTEGHTASNTVTVSFSNVPKLDPISVILGKVDLETSLNMPLGSASLAGAEFTIKYYPALVDDVTGLTPKYTWVITTDSDGYAEIPQNELPFVTNQYGEIEHGLPSGTIIMQETKAPTGYLINNTVYLRQIKIDENSAGFETYNMPIIREQVIRGGFKMQKTDKETGLAQAQGAASLQNATYTVTNVSGQSVRVGGVDYANNAVVHTFKTDENGRYTSPVDLLPYGDYRINETVASNGYLVNTTWSATLNIRTNGAIVDLTGNKTPEQIIRGGFKMQKIDSETGQAQAQGSASLKDATFTVTNISGQSVRVGGKDFANNAVCYTFKTDENGRFTSPADLLPYGNYRINETVASNGYLVNTTWSANVNIRTDGTIIDLTGNKVQEQIIRGGFKMQKRDKETGQAIPQGVASLQNATFTVANISGKSVRVGGVDYPNNTVVYTFTTDENGRFTSPANLLPYGNYRIREKTPSEGYLLNATWFADVNIRANGVIVDVTDNPAPEQIIRGGFKMQKTDKETGQARPQGAASLKDATFTVANISGRSVRVGGVDYPNNTVVYTFKTDENGRFASPANLLPYGNYRIREKTPSEGYLLNTQWLKDVYIRENGVIVDITNDPVPEQVIKGGLQLVKFKSGDNNLKTPLAGVEFTLTNQSDGQQVVITTDENGYADTGRYALAYGVWKVEETKTPDGLMPVPPFTVEVKENGKIFYFIVENDTIFSAVQLIKTDSETGQPVLLADTEFQIRNADTGDILEFVDYYPTYHTFTVLKTDNLGMCMLPQRLEMGRYELVEIKAPYEYLLDITPLTFEVTGGSEYDYPLEVRFADKPVKGKAELTKVDSITLQPLMGVEFSVYAREDIISADNTIHYMQGELVEIITTDEKGYACTKELRPGKYYLKESKTIDGYVLNETEYDFEVVAGDNLTPVVTVSLGNIFNEPTKVDFVKTDIETGQPIQGVAFELYDLDGNKLYSWMSETIPHRINALPQGEYILKEVETVYGYLLHNSEIRFTVQNTAEVQTVKVDNQPIKGAASLYKTDEETKNPLEGFEFGVYAREDIVTLDGTVRAAKDELVDTITTDGEGMARTKELYPGKYYFKEHKAAYGYLISEEEYDFELKAEDNSTPVIEIDTVSVFNQSIKGVASLYKTDGETQNPLEGFEFGVYAREDILTLDGTVRAAKDELVDTITTDGEGMARTKELYLGKYYFKEHKAAYGYLMSEEEYDFELKAEDNSTPLIEIDTINIFNQSIKGIASLYKTDGETQNPLKGFEFGVYAREDIVTLDGTVRASKDELVDTITTDGGGMAKTKELYLGKYYFKEHKAAYGYLMSEEEYDFELKAEDNSTPVIEIDTVSVFNQSIKGVASLYKTDGETQNPLEGFEFGVYAREDIVTLDGTVRASKDELVDTITTDGEGMARTKELYLGKYYFKEHKAAYGYLMSEEEYDFELKAEDNNIPVIEIDTVNIFNQSIKGIIEGRKIGSDTKKPLKGVEFGVYAREDILTLDGTVRAAKGELADTVVTDKNGCFKTKELYLGKYYVKEHKTAKGYILSEEEYECELVVSDNNTAVVTYNCGDIVNESVPPDTFIPTGDNTNTLAYVGIMSLSFVFCILYIKRKRHN